ncbi:MAG: hypothetical protein ACLT0Y_09275 [Christensenellales bacterium]
MSAILNSLQIGSRTLAIKSIPAKYEKCCAEKPNSINSAMPGRYAKTTGNGFQQAGKSCGYAHTANSKKIKQG